MLTNEYINATDPYGRKPLHYLAHTENPNGIHKIVRDWRQINANSTPLDLAAFLNDKSYAGDTPLHDAALLGHAGNVNALLHFGADPAMANNIGQTPLHLASQEGRIEAVEALLKNPELRKLVDNVDTNNHYTALHCASINGHDNVVRWLIYSGANINAQDKYGFTALHQAAICDELGVLKTLLKLEANPNLQNNAGDTPLHDLVRKDNKEAIRALIEIGANVHIENKNGKTADNMMELTISQIDLIKDIKYSLPASESERRLDTELGKEGLPRVASEDRATRLDRSDARSLGK